MFAALLVSLFLVVLPKNAVLLYPYHVETFSRVGERGLMVAHREEILISKDFGKSWAVVGRLPERTLVKQVLHINDSVWLFNTSYSGTGKVYATYDYGHSFVVTLASSPSNEAVVLDTASNTIFALDGDGRLCRSEDEGRTWSRREASIDFREKHDRSHLCQLSSIVSHTNRLFLASSGYPGKIFCSKDTGLTWTTVFSDSTFEFMEIPQVRIISDKIVACSAEGIIEREGALLIADSATVDFKIKRCPRSLWSLDVLQGTPTIVAGGFTLKPGSSVLRTHDFGSSWRSSDETMPGLIWKVESISGTDALLATDAGLIRYSTKM